MIKIRDGVDILDLLRRSGFTTYELRKQGIIGEARLQKLRRGDLPTWRELNFICWATAREIGEIIEYKYNGTPWDEERTHARDFRKHAPETARHQARADGGARKGTEDE